MVRPRFLTSFSLVSTRDDPNENDPDGLSTYNPYMIPRTMEPPKTLPSFALPSRWQKAIFAHRLSFGVPRPSTLTRGASVTQISSPSYSSSNSDAVTDNSSICISCCTNSTSHVSTAVRGGTTGPAADARRSRASSASSCRLIEPSGIHCPSAPESRSHPNSSPPPPSLPSSPSSAPAASLRVVASKKR